MDALARKVGLIATTMAMGGCTAELGFGEQPAARDEQPKDGSTQTEKTPGAPSSNDTPGEGGSSEGSNSQDDDAPLVFSRAGLATRLSKFEYTFSVLDALGVELQPNELDDAQGGIPDDTGDGVFKHLSDNQTSVEQHALAYFQVAESVAERSDIEDLTTQVGGCNEDSRACGQAFVEGIGKRLYRRPLDAREVDSILSVYSSAQEEGLNYVEAARWGLIALLQTPQFLFRMENEREGTENQPRQLDGYELAARLASFLWMSVPDAALLDAAADQSLVETEGLVAQVERMLGDPKAERFTEVFAVDFSRARFASFEGSQDADRKALNDSIVATFQDHFWTQRLGISELFLTTRYVVNTTVAELLGLPSPGDGLHVVDVSDLPQRVGLMSHPGMIAGMGDRAVGSFVNRGKYLMERLLCEHPAEFPATIMSQIEEFTATTTGLSERERAELRMERPQCWNCHKQFEPLAFGFARFDGAGRYVGETDADGKPLPLDGWVPTFESELPQYTDVPSYMEILAFNPVIQKCMTEHFVNFATSRTADEAAKAESERVGEAYLDSDGSLEAMVMAVTQSELFRTILPEPGVQP